jgi:hypothetical protein
MKADERARLTLARIHLEQAEAELDATFHDELAQVIGEAVTALREARTIDPEVTDDLERLRVYAVTVLRTAIDRLGTKR